VGVTGSGRSVIVLSILLGLLLGIGGYTFLYAEGLSYMSDDPKVCVNCHIMQPQYDSWQKASHHAVAACVDCHLPHGFVGKYFAKAENGYNHSKEFTLQDFHEPIMLKATSRRILVENCLHCHGDLVHDQVALVGDDPEALRCLYCHRSVGHGATTGLGRR
jgi:cytochrome c nitrite reductase small subunit